MENRTLKFRQPILDKAGQFQTWHYWGIGIEEAVFVGPLSGGRNNPAKELQQQFIGFQDKNGFDIYEGDLIKSDIVHMFTQCDIEEQPAAVVFNNKLAAFALELNGKQVLLSTYLSGWNSSVFEVVGNVIENPELVLNATT